MYAYKNGDFTYVLLNQARALAKCFLKILINFVHDVCMRACACVCACVCFHPKAINN